MCPVRFTSYREFTKHVGVIVSSSGTEHTETPSIVLVRLSYRNLLDGSHEKIQQAIGPHEDLLTIVKRRKLQWYYHVIRSGQNHLARLSERGKKTRQTEEEVGRQYQRMDRP